MREFKKGYRTYRILDEEKYERFWWGRKPSTRVLYEEWLMSQRSMRKICIENGKNSERLLQRTNQELRHQGIMETKTRSIGYDIGEAIVVKAFREVLF